MTRSRSLIFGIVSNYLFFAVNALVNIIAVPIMLAFLGKYEYGLWVTILSLIGYISVLDFGGNYAVSRFISEYRGKNQGHKLADITNNSLIIFSVLGAFAMAIVVAFSFILSTFLGITGNLSQIMTVAFLFVGLNAALVFPANVISGVIIGHQRLMVNNLINMLGVIVNFLTLLLVLKLGFGLIGVAASLLVSTILMLIVRLVFIKSIFPNVLNLNKGFNALIFREMFSFSFYFFVLNLGGQIIFNTGNLVIAKMLGIGMVAAYSIAFKVNQVAMAFIFKISDNFFPFFSELNVIGDKDKLKFYFLESSRLTMALAVAIFIILILWGKPMIIAYVGLDNFVGTSSLFLMALVMLMSSIIHAPAIALMALGKIKPLVIFNMLEAVSNLLLSIFLARYLGVVGVALGAVIAMFVFNFWTVPALACRQTGVSFWQFGFYCLFKPLILGIIMLILFYLIGLFYYSGSLFYIAGGVTLFLAIYFVLYVKFILSPEQRNFYLRKLYNARTNAYADIF